MAKDGRALRDEAVAATAAGKYKRALAAYLELERLEPRDAQWAKRVAETYRRLGNTKHAIEAYERAAERYAQNGFLVQAIAVCKVVLQIDPQHAGMLQRLARINEQVGQAPTRAQGFAENNPALHANPSVAALRRGTTISPPISQATVAPQPISPPPVSPPPSDELLELRPTTPTSPPTLDPVLIEEVPPSPPPPPSQPVIAISRAKSKPIQLPPGAGIDTVHLAREVPDSYVHSAPGIHVIPIDLDESGPEIEIEMSDSEIIPAEVDDATELDLEDIEEIPLPQPREIGHVAQRALAATPLFAGLPKEVLESLVAELTLVHLEEGQVLFHEGDPGDALYVVAEGEVAVQAEGPPRVELSRMGPGSFLGEVALMTDQPRSATVTATTASELLRIDRHVLARVLASHGDMLIAVLRFVRDRLVDRWLRTSPLFRPFDNEQRMALAARFKFLEIEPGTVLLGAGMKPDGLYIVLAGAFDVHRDGATVATLGPGDLIGETALLSGGTFRSDVVARGKGLALCMLASDFREVIMTHPHVLEYIGEQAEHSRRLQIL